MAAALYPVYTPALRRTEVTVLIALTWTACERAPDSMDPPPPSIAEPRLELSSETLVFPGLLPGETASETLEARNVGDAMLLIHRVKVSAGLAFNVVPFTDPIEVEPGEMYPIEISFTPYGVANTDTLTIGSNAVNEPDAQVVLQGNGNVPILKLTPASFTFDASEVPCGDVTEVRLKNDGTADLMVYDLEYEAEAALTLEPTEEPLPWVLVPGEARSVSIRFAPQSAGSFTGELRVHSDDPWGLVEAEQAGEGSYFREGDETFPIRGDETAFQLSAVPVPASVDVELDGVATLLFTVAGRLVTILEPDLATRDEVVISYAAAAQCD
jgi:hypothetical protein